MYGRSAAILETKYLDAQKSMGRKASPEQSHWLSPDEVPEDGKSKCGNGVHVLFLSQPDC